MNFFLEEEEYTDLEPEYAGVTITWLLKTIQAFAMCSELHSLEKNKAATKIQSSFRGWSLRLKLNIWKKSAIKIQKIWRGYFGRVRYFQILQAKFKGRITQHYNKSATLIQCTFRGYLTRKYEHSHVALRKLQLDAAAQLLRCVAVNTRQLVLNHQLPGDYSLRNSRCLSRVQNLLASLRFKKYNQTIRQEHAAELNKLNKAFEKCIKSKDKVVLPFSAGDGCQNRKMSLTCDREPQIDEDVLQVFGSLDLSFELYKYRRRSSEISNKIK